MSDLNFAIHWGMYFAHYYLYLALICFYDFQEQRKLTGK